MTWIVSHIGIIEVIHIHCYPESVCCCYWLCTLCAIYFSLVKRKKSKHDLVACMLTRLCFPRVFTSCPACGPSVCLSVCVFRVSCCVVPVRWCGTTPSQTAGTKRVRLSTCSPSPPPTCPCQAPTLPSHSRYPPPVPLVLLVRSVQRISG